MPGESPSMPPGFGVFIAFFVLIVVAGIGVTVYRSARMARRGQNPLTLREDLLYRAQRSTLLGAGATKAERLAELDRLLADGGISQAERDAARARILAE